jgi:lipopolysaccharide biosynthesis regulator YciM
LTSIPQVRKAEVDQTWLLLILFVIAIAIGWALGRRSQKKTSKKAIRTEARGRKNYLRGMNYLLNDESGKAVDVFIEALEVSDETLDTHIGLGVMMRKRGEVDEAVRVHQNLLSSSQSLSEKNRHLAQLELARDFHAAGLFDRAENLLQEMVEVNSPYRRECLLLLVEIYRDEKEWEKAIHAANLIKRRRLPIAMPRNDQIFIAQSHFCCELAEEAFANKDYLTTRRWVKQAFGYDKSCVRASIIWGKMQMAKGKYGEAIKIMKKIFFQEGDFQPEALLLVAECYRHKGDRNGYYRFLQQCLEKMDSVSVVLQLADSINEIEGEEAAVKFIGDELKRRPSIRGLNRLIEMYEENTQGRARENISLLRQLVERLIISRPAYRCRHCGFSGKEMHWLCPGCKTWGNVRVIQGLEGE